VQQNLWNGELKRPLGRPEPRWEGNIEISVEEIECNCVSCICLVQEGLEAGGPEHKYEGYLIVTNQSVRWVHV